MEKDPAQVEHYAGALLELARATGSVDRIAEEARAALDFIAESREVRRFLGDAAVTDAGKGDALRRLLGAHVHPALLHFLLILTHEDRLALFPSIVEAFLRQESGSDETVWGELCAARPPRDEQLRAIETELSRRLGRPVRLRVRTDAGVIGGARVRVGDVVVDGTIDGQLDAIRARLLA
ncbi:MAG: ATP synthase F1 subunit delta [Kiritimatiellae bacterium]|nr:ATP synthase F1 subunit delta [Kiritimatiellia bacterium]